MSTIPESTNPSGIISGFPQVPSWWCWLTTRHQRILKYADYCADISGWRCRCGKRWHDNDYLTPDSAREGSRP